MACRLCRSLAAVGIEDRRKKLSSRTCSALDCQGVKRFTTLWLAQQPHDVRGEQIDLLRNLQLLILVLRLPALGDRLQGIPGVLWFRREEDISLTAGTSLRNAHLSPDLTLELSSTSCECSPSTLDIILVNSSLRPEVRVRKPISKTHRHIALVVALVVALAVERLRTIANKSSPQAW